MGHWATPNPGGREVELELLAALDMDHGGISAMESLFLPSLLLLVLLGTATIANALLLGSYARPFCSLVES